MYLEYRAEEDTFDVCLYIIIIVIIIIDCIFVQPLDFIKNKDEYALSKDRDVVMWLHYRTFHNLSLPTDAFDFVITEDLHRNFDEFIVIGLYVWKSISQTTCKGIG